MNQAFTRLSIALTMTGALAACGGGGGEDETQISATVTQQQATAEAGYQRFDYWRQRLGLSTLTRNARLDQAAQAHSDYQATNGVISHYQEPGKSGFTGECLGDSSQDPRCTPDKTSRMEAAGLVFTQPGYAFGEVISRTASTDGAAAADALIAAIYHRFVIFEPMFKEIGVGAARRGSGSTYFTTNFAADGLDGGLPSGGNVVYPLHCQTGVPRNFFSNQEAPDPVPGRDEVGYPISLHANITTAGVDTVVNVTSFTVRPAGGTAMAVQQLWQPVDGNTPRAVAAIVPLDVLQADTVYEVQFSGTVAGVPVSRNWSFSTGTQAPAGCS